MIDSTGLKPQRASHRIPVKFALAVLWLVFTVALASWWLIFGLSQLSEIRQAGVTDAAPSMHVAMSLERQHRMLLSEGGVLIAFLLGGGVALLSYVRGESLRARQVEEFFASFTHDLKTSLASLRIQTESLRDDLEVGSTSVGFATSSQGKLLARIMSDAGRLETQLENALFLADADKSAMLLEPVSVGDLVASLAHLWPRMKIEFTGCASVLADRRALESIIRNLAQNSSRHGQATKLQILCSTKGAVATLRFVDDGLGFRGDPKRLGEIFARQSGSSGSGIGLYLVARLVDRLGGRARVVKNTSTGPSSTGDSINVNSQKLGESARPGFQVEIELPIRESV